MSDAAPVDAGHPIDGGTDSSAPDGGPPGDAALADAGSPEGYAYPIYLNFSGLRFEDWLTGDQETVPAFRYPAGKDRAPAVAFEEGWQEERGRLIEDIVTEVERIFAPFDVEVVTVRPPEEGYAELVIGGDVEDSGDDRTSCAIGGHAPSLCGSPDPDDGIRRGFVHSACKDLPRTLLVPSIAGTIAHEAGHLFSLEHADSGGIMAVGGDNEWREGPVTDVDGRDCRTGTQDSHEVLMRKLGARRPRLPTPPPPDTTAPEADAIVPEEGASIPPTFGPCMTVRDDSALQYAYMQVYASFPDVDDYLLLDEQALAGGDGSYRFRSYDESGMPSLTESSDIVYRMFVRDEWGNLTETRRHVRFEADAAAPTCP